MKRILVFSLAAILCAGAFVPASADAASISITVGDRPYYHGPYYYEGHRRLYWVPGHYIRRHHHRIWIHGHYERRW
jgi:hypothetical protein